MATATRGQCPHCTSNLTFLEGVTGGTMQPICPVCRKIVEVKAATLLMPDHTRRLSR